MRLTAQRVENSARGLRLARVSVLVLVCVSWLLVDAAMAQVQVDHVDASSRPAIAYFHVRGAPSAVTGLTVKVSIDGTELPVSAAPDASPGAVARLSVDPPRSEVVLMIDVSRSVSPRDWQRAQGVLRRIVGDVPADWPVSVITVGEDVRRRTASSTDRRAVEAMVAGLSPTDDRTRLYDALLQTLRPGGPIVVLATDGLDSGSLARMGDVMTRAAAASAPIIAIDLSRSPSPSKTAGQIFLERLTSVSGGSLDPSRLATLTASESVGRGVVSFDAPVLANAGMHDLRIALADAATGAVVGETSQAFYAKGRASDVSVVPSRVGWASWWNVVALLGAIVVGAVLGGMLWTRRGSSPDSSTPEVLPARVDASPQMRDLREQFTALRHEADTLEKRFVEYGHPLEQKAQRWRTACQETARRAVAPMTSCWLMRGENPLMEVVYNEMLASLSAVGLIEVAPSAGDSVNEDDRRHIIRERRGDPPYRVVRVLSPGFQFSPKMPWQKESGDDVQLSAAELEVEGTRVASHQAPRRETA